MRTRHTTIGGVKRALNLTKQWVFNSNAWLTNYTLFVLSLCMCVHSSICSLHFFLKTVVPVTRFKDSTYYDLMLISNLDCVVNTLCIGVHVLRIEASGTYLAVI